MNSPADNTRTARLATRIRSHFEQVIERSHGILRNAASSRRLDPAEADELVQELRVRLWKVAGDDANSERLSPAYVHRTAMTAAIDIIRRRRSSSFADVAAPGLALESHDHADAIVDQGELALALETSLATMVKGRAAVVRMHLAGYERHEIAALLGWSEAKTRNLLYRGMSDVRVALQQRGFAP